MRIAVDVRSPGRRGVLTYVNSMLPQLVRAGAEHEFTIVKDRGFELPQKLDVETIDVGARNPFGWLAWSNTRLRAELQRRAFGIYHTFKHVTLLAPITARRVATLHGGQMTYERPDLHTPIENTAWRFMYGVALNRYDKVIVMTGEERRFLTEGRGVVRDRIAVIPLAPDERFKQRPNEEALAKARLELNLPDRFLLCVAAFAPMKNHKRLLRAYACASTMASDLPPLALAGVGGKGKHADEVRALPAKLGIADKILFLGRLSDHHLLATYALAEWFIMPSIYENFGLVLLEAMSMGLPVITSDIPHLDDAVADTALRVDPYDVDALAATLVRATSSPSLRARCVERAREHSARFSWEGTAKSTIELYEQLTA